VQAGAGQEVDVERQHERARRQPDRRVAHRVDRVECPERAAGETVLNEEADPAHGVPRRHLRQKRTQLRVAVALRYATRALAIEAEHRGHERAVPRCQQRQEAVHPVQRALRDQRDAGLCAADLVGGDAPQRGGHLAWPTRRARLIRPGLVDVDATKRRLGEVWKSGM